MCIELVIIVVDLRLRLSLSFKLIDVAVTVVIVLVVSWQVFFSFRALHECATILFSGYENLNSMHGIIYSFIILSKEM